MNIISKAEFARQAGVTSSAISKALNTALKEALSGDGIDADHPAAIRYLSRCGHVGRPHGGGKSDLAAYVVSRSDELRKLERNLTNEVAPLVKSISDNLFYLGFEADRMKAGDRSERTAFIERNLDYLQKLAGASRC